MTTTYDAKILTPMTLGGVDLAHRAVVLARAGLSPQAIAGLATRGGLVIQPPSTPRADWASAAARLHDAGAFLIAALPAATPLARAKAAMAAGCDGIELDTEGLGRTQLLRRLDAALHRWGAERLGVRIRCRQTAEGIDTTVDLLSMLNELELGFVHLANTPTRSVPHQRLRDAFRWPLIASGRHRAIDAIQLVESRWADAVGFAVADGPALLRRLRVAQRNVPAS